MQQRHRPIYVLDCFTPCLGDTARQCLRRADLCSRLAKLVRGQARKKLYRLKNANIRTALERNSGQIAVHADNDRYFGLLSVRLNDSDDIRVHTHENWIDAA